MSCSHFSAADFVHNFHAEAFKFLSSFSLTGPVLSSSQLWLRLNQTLGFSVSFLPLFAVTVLLIEELVCKEESAQTEYASWSLFLAAFKRRNLWLWVAALSAAMPVLLMAEHFEAFG